MAHGCLFSGYLGQESVDVVYLLKKPAISFVDWHISFNFIIFCSNLYYFLLSNVLGLSWSYFSKFLSFIIKSFICALFDFFFLF